MHPHPRPLPRQASRDRPTPSHSLLFKKDVHGVGHTRSYQVGKGFVVRVEGPAIVGTAKERHHIHLRYHKRELLSRCKTRRTYMRCGPCRVTMISTVCEQLKDTVHVRGDTRQCVDECSSYALERQTHGSTEWRRASIVAAVRVRLMMDVQSTSTDTRMSAMSLPCTKKPPRA